MREKNIPFDQLEEAVLCQLKEHGYMDSTLTIYRRIFNRIHRFLSDSGKEFYLPETGKEFLESVHVQAATYAEYACAVRRLDDYIRGQPYRCHHAGEDLQVPECYAGILDGYVSKCKEIGNRSRTVKAKEIAASRFLIFLWENECQELSCLDISLVSRALLTFQNKDNYPRVRAFLAYLADTGITPTDLSGIVPSHRRKKILPTAYTVDEIAKAEQAIDSSTDTGCRDLAMILLATRMGLRAGDIAKLRLDEIDFSTGYLHIIQEKTLVPLTLQMPAEVSRAIQKHLDNQTNYSDGYAFHSMSAPYGRVTPGIIRHAVNRYLITAGIDMSGRKHGTHALRSSMASSMVNDGASYETVRRILGHTDPDVIKHYARSDIANLRLCSIEPPPPSGFFKEYLNGKEVNSRV